METDVFVISVLCVMILNNMVMNKLGLYSERRYRVGELYKKIILANFIDFGGLSAGTFLFKQTQYSRLFVFLFLVLSICFISIERLLVILYIERFAKKGFNVPKILVVADREKGKFVSDILMQQLSWGLKIIGRLRSSRRPEEPDDSLGSIDDLPRILREHSVDEVVFALSGNRDIRLSPYLDICRTMGISFRILPSMWVPGQRACLTEMCQGVPFLVFRASNISPAGLLYKRILDLIGGLCGTLIFLVSYPPIALCIKLDSPGPVLFRQKRIGQHGRVFILYKYRSMVQDAEQRKEELLKNNQMDGAMFKIKDDPRITRVGRFLRKTSLDELPQFLNVLKGEMSLVGTRPPTPDEVRRYKPRHLKRIAFKPGITGLWQVSGRNKIKDFEKVVELDCKYLENWRFMDDVKILFKTIWVVLQRKGAL